MKARQEPMAAQADDRQGAAYPEGSRQEGRTGKRAEAARASMARATGGSRSGGTQAADAG